ncbi:hypothetical protein EVAR_40695_1 [Eumeta japonica]|uniref:Uncharacterized protein n=1 Tax=Eumeta variegata TaxID=151549 RepID=A0A4C1X8D9_EUMVA|nr:hypothetical protein EVAR_40695_1 [Eumeta japonica]
MGSPCARAHESLTANGDAEHVPPQRLLLVIISRPHVVAVMPSACDCPMGKSGHFGIGGHVKFTVQTETSEWNPGGAGSAPD